MNADAPNQGGSVAQNLFEEEVKYWLKLLQNEQ